MDIGSLASIQNQNSSLEMEIVQGKKNFPEQMKHNPITENQFLNAVKLLVAKPHIVNRKICGFELMWIGKCKVLDSDRNNFLQNLSSEIHSQNMPYKKNEKISSLTSLLYQNGFQKFLTVNKLDIDSSTIDWDEIGCSILLCSTLAIVRNIIPKTPDGKIDKILEIVIIDGPKASVHFISESMNAIPKLLPELSYSFVLVDNSIDIKIWKDLPPNPYSSKWLKNRLLPCLSKWASQMDNNDTIAMNYSLKLVDIQEYNKTYLELKQKYGPVLIENWAEVTDPLKYVYEDIAIASYLLVFWARERKVQKLVNKQSFIDLGCGNGLLVYLLTSEGHPGMGLDIKRRKIWDTFNGIKLKEEVIEPSDQHLYPEYDWLIGNHSDELTPWLPVIAAKSSMTTRFFIIPCCAFDFHCKFQRKNSKLSQYAEYLDYVQEVSSVCGFSVERDRLRIPSTKRVCFIGQKRIYKQNNWSKILTDIDNFIKFKCQSSTPNTSFVETTESLAPCETKVKGELWCDFKARDSVQKVRNCTQIGDIIRDKLVNDIATLLLLSEDNYLEVVKNDDCIRWNKGGTIPFNQLVNIVKPQLKNLKNENGGLQTLLRNHKFIFELSQGNVSLRVPESNFERKVSCERLKSKSCWFDLNHPQGCALNNENCTYLHANENSL